MRIGRTLTLALWAVLTSCGGAEVQPGLFFPTWDPAGAAPTGIVEGTLVFENDCLMLQSHGMRTFVVWEEGTGFSDWTLLDRSGDPVAHVGAEIHGGGGYFSDRAHVERLAGREIPERCIPEGSEPFALIYEVAEGPFE
jgi:hypothetical protein